MEHAPAAARTGCEPLGAGGPIIARHSTAGAIVLGVAVALAGCRAANVAPPELRRPIESVPSGARALVLTSDLRNTWQRVEAHDLVTLAERWPGAAEVAHDSALA